MEFEIDVERFIYDLPSQVQQARRQLFSGNLNALEFLKGRIEDFLNVRNVLCRRFEEVATDVALVTDFAQLLADIHALHGMFDDIVCADSDYLAELNFTQVECPDENGDEEAGLSGRPRKLVTKEELERLYDISRSWQEVAAQIGVSERMMYRRRQEFGMTTSSRSGARNTYSSISHNDLCTVIREILNILPNAGESCHWGM